MDEVDRAPKPVLDDISVVIPTLGRPILERCLASILGGDHWPSRIIVVYQGSEDRVRDLLGSLEEAGMTIQAVWHLPRGRAAALNQGIGQVETRYLAVTDDDCVVAPDWLARMHAGLQSDPNTVVSGRVEDVGDEESVAHALSMKAEVRTKPSLIYDIWSGGNSGMSRATFDRVGPFDEDARLRLAEDTEWAYRALRAGVNLAYRPDVCVWHYAWRDQEARAKQFQGYAQSHGGYYGKYIRQGDLFIALKALVHLTRALRRWFRGLIQGNANMADHGRAYSLGLVPGIIRGFQKPRKRDSS